MASDDVPSFGEQAAGSLLKGGGEAANTAGDDRPLQRRLGRLKCCAATSQASARAYLRAAGGLLRTASRTDEVAPIDLAPALFDAVRETRRRAQKCLGFASLCRRRALRLARTGDSLFD
ncbi:MAG: hypothetical protein U1E38_03215 [Rhodospirillales bacterium]